ncbi:MAG TPA: M28 family peptidase [Bacteroidales bacterium]|nr:M28 family peptidase [Bacteroidales bacterium]
MGSIAQEFDPFIQSKVDELQYDSLFQKLLAFENFGIKQVGTDALDETANWILQQYTDWGYTNIELDTLYVGQNSTFNIIVTKTGSVYPDTYFIVDGHYDTYNGPGVNDNGSGTAIVLEMARMLKDVETAYSIKFIHFTVEELGLVGSTHYVENTVVPQEMDIKLLLNIDEVGGVAGTNNNTITCERDEWSPTSNNAASAAYTDTLANLTEMYSNLNTDISYAYGSDYVPFMDNGYVVTGYYEYNESPYPHSINDSLSNMDPESVFELTKASLASCMYFAGAQSISTGIPGDITTEKNIEIYPNPFAEYISVKNITTETLNLQVYDLNGRLQNNFKLSAEATSVIRTKLKAGTYFYKIFDEDQEIISSGKIIKTK